MRVPVTEMSVEFKKIPDEEKLQKFKPLLKGVLTTLFSHTL